MSRAEFKDKFVAFIDVLGFKSLVSAAEAGTGRTLSELLQALQELGPPERRDRYVKNGPTDRPQAADTQRDFDFRVTQISDSVVVSSEVSPAGVIKLISHCWEAVINLLAKGIMCRGYITRGLIYHIDDQIIGSGYQNAFSKEYQVSAFKREADERGTPFVEVDRVVCDYVRDYGDSRLFSRFTRSDGDVTALFPFQALSPSFTIGGGSKFDGEKEKRSVQNLRASIKEFKEQVISLVDQSNPSVVSKARHYLAALDAQLRECDTADDIIDGLRH